MRYPFESAGRGGTSWIAHKNEGKSLYERGKYQEALNSYKAALEPSLEAPRQERQILLSNIVACRLKLGGSTQAAEAVEDAKNCVDLNPQWAKGHVRLASAYIALGGHSNDACNELQTALRLDPGNSLARQMLVRELRRDHAAASAAAPSGVDDGDYPHDPPLNPEYTPTHQDGGQPHTVRFDDDPIDDSLSFSDRISFYLSRVGDWYNTRSDDAKLMLKVLGVILLLYVAFGGRFGLENMFATNNSPRRGHYGQGNIYDQYRQRDTRSSTGSTYDRHDGYRASTTGRSTYSQGGHNSYGGTYNDYSYGNGGGYYGGGYGGGYSMGLDSLPSLAILLGVAYICHRNGINPLHAMFMMNMMGGRRRRRFGYGMGGMGMGGGGFGYGGRMRYGGRRGRW